MVPPPSRMVPPQQMYPAPAPPHLGTHPMTVLPPSVQPVINEVDTNTQSSRNEEEIDGYPEINPMKSETELESDEEDVPTQFIVSPNLYIPMPHVSIKQFILRNETSV